MACFRGRPDQAVGRTRPQPRPAEPELPTNHLPQRIARSTPSLRSAPSSLARAKPGPPPRSRGECRGRAAGRRRARPGRRRSRVRRADSPHAGRRRDGRCRGRRGVDPSASRRRAGRPLPAVEEVVAVVVPRHPARETAVENIAALVTAERVVAAVADEAMISPAADDDVGALVAVQHVVARPRPPAGLPPCRR